MGRPPKFSTDQLLDAAAELVVSNGPAGLTATSVADAVGAPSGSVYHRFGSRDELAAALWMRTVERFDDEVVSHLADPGDPVDVAVAVALRTIEWTTAHPVDAFILTMFRRADLAADPTSPDLADRAEALGERQRRAVEDLAERLEQPIELVAFAVAGIAMAAMRPHLGERSPIPTWVPDAVERAVRAALAAPPNGSDRR